MQKQLEQSKSKKREDNTNKNTNTEKKGIQIKETSNYKKLKEFQRVCRLHYLM